MGDLGKLPTELRLQIWEELLLAERKPLNEASTFPMVWRTLSPLAEKSRQSILPYDYYPKVFPVHDIYSWPHLKRSNCREQKEVGVWKSGSIKRRIDINIIYSCKAVYQEAVPILYQMNTFALTLWNHRLFSYSFLDRLDSASRLGIRSVEIGIGSLCSFETKDRLRDLVQRLSFWCPNLRLLRLEPRDWTQSDPPIVQPVQCTALHCTGCTAKALYRLRYPHLFFLFHPIVPLWL